jgi:hypothetical protein
MGLFARKIIETIPVPANGFGAPTQYHFSNRGRDYGIGANDMSFDTLQLPTYSVIGWGVSNKRTWLSVPSAPVVAVAQGVPRDSLGSPGNLTGQFVSQPLLSGSTPDSQTMAIPRDTSASFLIPTGALS